MVCAVVVVIMQLNLRRISRIITTLRCAYITMLSRFSSVEHLDLAQRGIQARSRSETLGIILLQVSVDAVRHAAPFAASFVAPAFAATESQAFVDRVQLQLAWGRRERGAQRYAKMPHLGITFPETLGMALDEQQKLLNAGE